MSVTINDIAKKVGVSLSTVSRVINGNASISEATKEKIYSAMNELDYHPNSIARNLANGSTKTISLIIDVANNSDNFSNMFFYQSISGIEKATQMQGYNLLISGLLNSTLEKTVRKIFLEKKSDGIIIPSSLLDRQTISFLNKEKFPFVVLGEPPVLKTGCSWVDINNSQGSEMAVLYLVDRGYRHIAFFGGDGSDLFNKYRIKGYEKAAASNEMLSGAQVVKTSSDKDQMYEAALRLIGQQKFDAVIANDNISAYCILKAATKLGVNVPEELGIITFDSYPLAEFLEPQLTSLDIDTASQGEMAAEILLKKIQNKDNTNQQILVSVRLQERQSTRKGGDR